MSYDLYVQQSPASLTMYGVSALDGIGNSLLKETLKLPVFEVFTSTSPGTGIALVPTGSP